MISYIIATYSNTLSSRIGCYANTEGVLQLQLEQLYVIFNNKKLQNIDNLIEKIIVVMPEPEEKRNIVYYQSDKWRRRFLECQVSIEYVDYIGDNLHHSYDQWIQGYLFYSKSDYYIVMEDDYCIDKSNLTFDIDLIRLYKEKCPDNVGYLGCLVESCWGVGNRHAHAHAHTAVMAISNGIISRESFEKIGTNILQKFYAISSLYPQLSFSIMFINDNVPLLDLQDEYVFPFWDSTRRQMVTYSRCAAVDTRYIIIPVQLAEAGDLG
jgi:hypothetical protein